MIVARPTMNQCLLQRNLINEAIEEHFGTMDVVNERCMEGVATKKAVVKRSVSYTL